MYVDPSHENVQALIERDIEGPIVMLNLLRFREVANYDGHPELAPPAPISGSAAYERFVRHTSPFLEVTGGSIVMMAAGGNEQYLAGIGHRTAAVEDTRLLPLVEVSIP